MGSSLFWFDNWTRLGALYFNTPDDFYIDESVNNVADVVTGGVWDADKLANIVPVEYAVHIIDNIKPPSEQQLLDKPYWCLETAGFTIQDIVLYVESVEGKITSRRLFEESGILHAFTLLVLCATRGRNLRTSVFFSSFAANKVWSYFLRNAGINLDGMSMYQAIVKCWTIRVVPRLKPIFQELPSIILWELWKRRNSYKHGEAVTIRRVIYQVSTIIQSLVRLRKPGLVNVPQIWPNLLHMMEHYTPPLKVTKVLWEMPPQGWIKVNCDGASRGNPGRSSIGYALRDDEGDIKYACGKLIHDTTNNVAEALEIVEALKYCEEKGFAQVILQTDSLLLKNAIEGIWAVPWVIAEYVEDIVHVMTRMHVNLSHIMREGNCLADHLANHAIDIGNIQAHCFQELDIKGRKILNNDKLQCPYLRVKVTRF
ncbi:uncharacterized protein [Nicotiana sylvestris]|uniref:uncharacterized protein n=1 Tax=Nicotiana sylvestris TaxID=4096 RepID=UPI00388CBF24